MPNLKVEKSNNKSLQFSKVACLKNVSEEKSQHPYYLFSLLVSGDAATLDSTSYFWLYMVGGIILILLILFLYLKRKKYL